MDDHLSRVDRVSGRLLAMALAHRSVVSVGLTVAALAAGFVLTWLLGGTHHVPPHWFYVPIVLAGVRFGVVGSVPTAVASAVLAGPLMPADVATGMSQDTGDWVVRGAFFVALGVVLPSLMRRGTDTIQQERRDRRVDADVRRGLADDEFVLHYQPIVDLADGRIIGAEALLRWDHPDRGFLAPAAFIDDVERIGSIATWVLGEATSTAARWIAVSGRDDFYVSVNISAQNLAQPDIVAQVRTALRAAGLAPRHLCVEITESAAIDDVEVASARLQVLRSLGVRIALDDFGTGHSTLAYLQQLPMDIIKIDRGFVDALDRTPEGHAIVASMCRITDELGATCVAEGVETDAQRRQLVAEGCVAAQGYHFARPVPATDFEHLLALGALPPPGPPAGSDHEAETLAERSNDDQHER